MNKRDIQRWWGIHQKSRWVLQTYFPGMTEVQWPEFLYHFALSATPNIVNGEEIEAVRIGLATNNGIIWTNRV